MADLVGCVKEIGKCILTQCIQPPVKRHFDYWWCFDDNIQGLRAGIEELKREKHYIEQKSEEARLRTHILCPGVDEWLKASTEKLEEAQKILLPDHNIPNAFNLISRYSLGKNAKKTAQEIENIRNKGNFNPIADPAPPAAMASPCHRLTMEFESRKSIEKDIIDSLKKSSVDMIGICGMGGVGKTTMAKRIRERVKEEDLFDEVVMVTVSQPIDMPKIQNEIADLLKLKFDESSMSARAYQLRTRLMDAKRKIIIFDDVWESLKFEELGIPVESNFERCKVLLTSRSRDTCKRIKNKVVFDLKILEEEEAWILFKEKAGKCVEDSALRFVAKDVVEECKGLPIALVAVGIALQEETSIYKWKDSLSQLRKSNPIDFPEVLTNVYKPLKLSYDYLENDSERDLFLMCCLFHEDYDIPIEQLTWYSMGLRLFDDITNIEEARNRTHSLVEKLKSRFLLIAGGDKLHVKMHDVVRDVAIYIGSRENHGFLKSLYTYSIENSSDVNCNWMSVDISNEEMEVPVLSRFPKLRLLMLLKLSSNQFSDISFEGMEDLNVLSFQSISIRSLPPTLGSLENLQTLRLFRCKLKNISVIGKLTSLKILSCRECENIRQLPAEIGSLKDLILLELSKCSKLQRIPFGIISSLSLLEELKIGGSFSKWETGGQRRNASLTELEHLRNLTCLEIEISDWTLSAQEIHLSQKLVIYRMRIAGEFYYDFEDRDYEKEMILYLPGAVGNWIQLLARNAEFLILIGDGSENINLAEMENLRSLKFTKCSTVKKLCNLNQNNSLCNLKTIYISGCSNLKHVFSVSVAATTLLQLELLFIQHCAAMEQLFWNEGTDNNTDGCIEFPKLKELRLEDLPNLTAFCQGLENIIIKFPNLIEMKLKDLPKLNSLFPPNSKDVPFGNLKSIYVGGCDNLRSLFSVSARRCLLQLENLEIYNCKAMEQVFWNEGTDDNTDGCIEFPKLKELTLRNLPNLTAFCQGLENIIIKFPNLTQMVIGGLTRLNSIFPLNSETVVWHDENTYFHFVCNPKNVSFCYLKSIYVGRCENLRYLFSVSVRRWLLQLEVLQILSCELMEQVFWNEDTDDNTYGCIEFPKLKELRLFHLRNLTALCQGLENIIINFPNLTEMKIKDLPKLNSLFPNNPKDLLQLEVLCIEDCKSMEQVFRNEIKDDNTDGCIEFPKLKELTLFDLPNLTAFCQGLENTIIKFPNLTDMSIGGLSKLNSLSPLNSETVVWHDQNTCFHFVCNPKDVSFCNLKSIYVGGCDNLRYLFSVSAARKCLQDLKIYYCEVMEQVFWNEGTDDNTDGSIDFPKLEQLSLRNLPNLTAFCQGLENIIIKFPNLTVMDIGGLPKLNSLSPLNSETVVWHDQNTCFHFVCNPKDVSFRNLKSIYISRCDNLRYLFSVWAARRCLLQLEVLHIEKCAAMEQVFWNEGTDDNTDGCIEFPKLKILRLKDLQNLTAFCQGLENIIIKFPNQTEISIEALPKLNSLFPLNSKSSSTSAI